MNIETRSINIENLKIISSLLTEIPHFVFFGSLLGIVRENSLLRYDDDVDILVDIKFYEQIVQILKSEASPFEVDFFNEINSTGYFLNCRRTSLGYRSQLDFYFYTNSSDQDYIIERWNFRGFSKINDPNYDLHIPKSLIFPIKKFQFPEGFSVKIPNQSEQVVAWLYGDGWRTPLSKGTQYVVNVVDNKPYLNKIGIAQKFYNKLKKRMYFTISSFRTGKKNQ